eukprot:11228302-Lingulodinium_polyedra.AAC.2
MPASMATSEDGRCATSDSNSASPQAFMATPESVSASSPEHGPGTSDVEPESLQEPLRKRSAMATPESASASSPEHGPGTSDVESESLQEPLRKRPAMSKKPAGVSKKPASVPPAAATESGTNPIYPLSPMPASLKATDVAGWALQVADTQGLLDVVPERIRGGEDAVIVGSLCTGMGTEVLATDALVPAS